MKNYKSLSKEKDSSEEILIKEVKSTLDELKMLKNNYQFATGDMIDYYIHQIKALEIKYNYLLNKLKQYNAV
jgi:hypothetical protein